MQSNKSNGQMTAQVSVSDHKKSGFDLSNNVLGTGKIGRIIPTRALHVMPGDTIKQDSKVAVQFEPLAVPILANMEVKQEHFYVPYNVVWKNWDKFISGGEKMDYKGIVPNVSMKSIFQAVENALPINFNILQATTAQELYNPNTSNVDHYEFGIELDSILSANPFDMIDAYNTASEMYNAKDLLAYIKEVVEVLKTTERTTKTLFVAGYTDSENTLPSWLNTILENNPLDFDSQYIERLLPYYKEAAASYQLVVIPTNEGVKWLSVIYEFYKPLVGLGSNIDYLNMGRISLTDFILAFANTIRQAMANLDMIIPETINLALDNEDTLFANQLSNTPMSILHLRASYSVWYNNYRDILLEENVIEPKDIDEISRQELFNLLLPRQRCWEKDAFTTALDNPGTGNVGVPITRDNSYASNIAGSMHIDYENGISFSDSLAVAGRENDMSITEVSFSGESWRIPTAFLTGQNSLSFTDEDVNGFSLYALDAAQRAQKWLQKALFFGNRISDFYYLRFGVRYLDARLRLPELLTSSSELVKLDVVMNNTNITTEAGGEVFSSVAGDRAAYASAYDNGNNFDRFCEEHGVILSYLTIMPQVTYAYGTSRDYSRLDQFDFAFSEFATLGMDAVYDTEITSTSFVRDAKVFGYQGKYYDYKAKHSEEHGELLDTQDMYTFARKFDMYSKEGAPKLNYEFVHCFPSLDMFVVDSKLADYFRYDIRHSTAAERGLPSQSIYI